MPHIVNNRETSEGEAAHYIDNDGNMHEAVINSIEERDGNHFADMEVQIDGQPTHIADVPHNTSPEKHSWNHVHEPLTPEELKRYGYV